MKDSTAHAKPGALSFAKGISYRVPNWHLMSYPDGTAELYDMQSDPQEFNNLASDRAYQEQFTKLQAELQALQQEYNLK